MQDIRYEEFQKLKESIIQKKIDTNRSIEINENTEDPNNSLNRNYAKRGHF